MSLFFDYKALLPQNSIALRTAWSSSEHNALLAIATNNNQVCLFQDEGDRLEDVQITRQKVARFLAWHPSAPVLAVGWEDGCLTIWNGLDKMTRDDTTTHRASISALCFSPDGTRLVSADESGVVSVWRTDARGRLNPLCSYRKTGAITHIVFCTNMTDKPHTAVATVAPVIPATTPLDTPYFLFGGDSGKICFADDLNHCTDVHDVGGPIRAMLWYEQRRSVVLITSSLVLAQIRLVLDGKPVPERKVKLSVAGDVDKLKAVWAGPGLLATVSGENLIRLWNLEVEENYILSLADVSTRFSTDRILSVAYNPRKRVLACGTKEGKVITWRYLDNLGSTANEQAWAPLPPNALSDPITELEWGPGESLISCIAFESVSILHEAILTKKIRDRYVAVQTSTDRLLVETPQGQSLPLQAGIRIKGVDLTAQNLVIWNGKKIEVYEIANGLVSQLHGFPSRATSVGIHGDSLYACVGSKIEVCSFNGTVKQTLAFTESEGEPLLVDINGHFLVVGTSVHSIKIWDISRRPPKQLGVARKLDLATVTARTDAARAQAQKDKARDRDIHGNFGLRSVACNVDGSRLSLLIDIKPQENVRVPDSRLFIYDTDLDTFASFDFGPDRYPISHMWDVAEPRLMAVETQRFRTAITSGKTDASADASSQQQQQPSSGIEVVTLFATAEHGIMIQDRFTLERPLEALLGVRVPYLLCLQTGSLDQDESSQLGFGGDSAGSRVYQRVMRDFVGLEDVEDTTRQALLNFSFFLTCGNMDEAYKAVRLIKNPNVWENMARMCVKTKRLDVAEVCLGQMGHARGAKAVREAKSEPESEAQLAMVAIQLGLVSDAEQLYESCGRFDLLNRMYQAQGEWEKALKTAEAHDRIHLRTTHYQYARHLESIGDSQAAIKHYSLSDTHRVEVPRMMCGLQQIQELETYINGLNDPELQKWWGQYLESKRQLDKALTAYRLAQDYASIVRILCFRKETNAAQELCLETNDQAAAYQLARHLEAEGQYKDAIQMFSKAQRLHHAMRLAQQHGLDHELMRLALRTEPKHMLQAARYFEEKEMYEKAVTLYHKAGSVRTAVELCFQAQLFDLLRTVADDLAAEHDPALLARVAEFFMAHEQFEKAVQLLVVSQQIDKALEMCLQHNVTVTEELAEKMTPERRKDDDGTEDRERLSLLRLLAKICKKQGSYQLACKKYTQAGDKLKAVKALLKSGDTERIIFFANTARSPEIYILAANYLQNSDWHNDEEIMKAIISFYTKAKAMEQLSGFYDACAQVEIDEYRDYEKALGALKEALKYMTKGRSADKEQKINSLNKRIGLVERFVAARRLVKSDPKEMVSTCLYLLDQPDIESALRAGDVFAFLIEFYHGQGKLQEAYNLIERMRQRRIILSPYLDQEIVDAVYHAMGIEIAEDGARDDIGEEIDEEVN
eukprot:GILK01005459.1.p1 GENE.GILK01005459.1~~GILK01005459.1.p1  ORF type:complete len:1424 (+),score=370.05 GILK01005459.1:129-4400(+)